MVSAILNENAGFLFDRNVKKRFPSVKNFPILSSTTLIGIQPRFLSKSQPSAQSSPGARALVAQRCLLIRFTTSFSVSNAPRRDDSALREDRRDDFRREAFRLRFGWHCGDRLRRYEQELLRLHDPLSRDTQSLNLFEREWRADFRTGISGSLCKALYFFCRTPVTKKKGTSTRDT